MKNVHLKLSLAILALAIIGFMGETTTRVTRVYGQANHSGSAVTYKLIPTGQVAMKLTGTLNLFGTSTLHDWTMSARSLQGNAQFSFASDGSVASIDALNFILPVKNLKGEKDGLNDNAYEALKADKYTDIRFQMTSSTITAIDYAHCTINAKGNLTIAGVTRQITMEVKTQLNADGTISCSGTQALKMSEYNIERPSFMFGAMKTGDDLKLNFNLVFVR